MNMNSTNIPKVIHYCWFGGKEKPEVTNKCMKSWKRQLSNYEMIEWNEDNFDINVNAYVKAAYEAGKFAFVSDYVRVYALYNYGGIYLDTDVEVFKPFDNLLDQESFWGFEQENFIATSTIGAAKGNKLIKIFLDSFQGKSFVNEDGTFNELTNVALVTDLVENMGLQLNGEFQLLDDFGAFFPQTYFSPFDYINCRYFISDNTYTMHHFYKSWLPLKARIKSKLKIVAARVIGGENIYRIRMLFTRP